jgi:predicted Zn finger-like uncharacterized protein
MDVSCPACAARYTADEQKLRGKTARMRCKACDNVWLVSGPEDKMSEAKRAAVVKRGADRDHRDLFASRPADLGSVKQTLRPPPGEQSGVAARNETSVLFTVDSLRGAARVKTPEPEPAPLSTSFIPSDDEGVIDLKALASSPPQVGARSVAPLFSEPPPAAFAADVMGSGVSDIGAAPGGFKLGKRAFAGIAAAAVAVVLFSGLAAAFKGEEPVARVSATSAMIAPPVTPPAPVVIAPAAPVIAPVTASNTSTSSSDDADTASASGKGKKGKKGKGGKAAASGLKVQSSGVASSKKASSSEPLVSKPAPKAADKCGCKGDFNCILRCTAKGS